MKYFILFLFFSSSLSAQKIPHQHPSSPSRNGTINQDCESPIPLCHVPFIQTHQFSGYGNDTVINSLTSCLGNGEENCVWYSLTTTSAGNLGFTLIIPDTTDDYDWAVYNMTGGAGCPDNYVGGAPMVSCNWSGDEGNTGPNGLDTPSVQDGNGSAFNALIPVNSGETYYIIVNYYHGNQSGYTMDFSPSTATFGMPPATITAAGSVLSSNYSTGNQWYYSSSLLTGATSQQYTALVAGDYFVVVTADSCTDTSAVFHYVPAGVESIIHSPVYVIFTNSIGFNRQFYFQNEKHCEAAVMDVTGKTVQTNSFNKGYHFVDLPRTEFPAGIYFLQIKMVEGIFTEKILVN